MKLYQLEYFVEVFKCKSISKAAERLFVSQPAISFGIKELEDEFGIKLFSRSGNRIIQTEAGELFFERAERLITDVETLRKEMQSFGASSVLIKVGTPPMIGTMLFPDLYNSLSAAHPKIKMEILEYGSLQAQNMVLNNNADVAVAILDNLVDDQLETNPLLSTELVYCVSKSHALAGRRDIEWRELEGEEIILMKEDSYQNAIIKKHIAQSNMKMNILLYSSQLTTIKNFITNSNAGAFLIKEVAEADPSIASVTLKQPIKLNIGILWKKNSRLYSDVKNFIAFTKGFVESKWGNNAPSQPNNN